jgi:hypothetical protein
MRLMLSCTGGACSRGYKLSESEREREFGLELSELASSASLPLYLPLLAPLLRKALDIPFYRYKEMVQLYNGGVAMC